VKRPDTPTKPRPARRSARESLVRLVRDYAPVAPFLASLLASRPEPKVPEPDPRRAQRGGDPGADGTGTADGGGSS